MSAMPNSLLGYRLKQAQELGHTKEEKIFFQDNALTQITVWSDRDGAAELHDYAAKEWGGLLGSFYYMRWEKLINTLRAGEEVGLIDWYAVESDFVKKKVIDQDQPVKDLKPVLESIFKIISET